MRGFRSARKELPGHRSRDHDTAVRHSRERLLEDPRAHHAGELAMAVSRAERVLGRLQHLLGSTATAADDGRLLECFLLSSR